MSATVERHQPDEADYDEPSDEEQEADTDPPLAERFGAALQLDALAGGDVLRYEAVLALDADTCLMKLNMLGAQAGYQRRLQKLFHAKKD